MNARLLFFLLLPLASCYKDEVDIDALNTNPLDADYTGPAFIFVTGQDTYSPTAGVYNQEVYVTVDASVFPSPTAYQLRVEEVNSGDVVLIQQDLATPDEFTHTNFNVDLGVDYCYEISVEIQISQTREENSCATAEL